MTNYLIAYDLSKPGQNYDDLIEHLKSYGTYAHVQKSVWIVASDGSAESVRDAATAYMDANDKIFVVALGREAAWRGASTEITDWLKSTL